MRTQLLLFAALMAPLSNAAESAIPQDPAKMEQRRLESLEWNRRSLGEAYDKVGKRDKRWDAAAREALDKAARRFSQQVDPVVTTDDIHVATKKAIAAGCNDPMILYLYARTTEGKAYPGPEAYEKRFRDAGKAMAASRYAPSRRALAIIKAAEFLCWKEGISAEQRREAERQLDAALDLLPASVTEEQRNYDWENNWYNSANAALYAHKQLSKDLAGAHAKVDAKLAKVKGAEFLRFALQGNILIAQGWEARTSATAALVSQEQFRVFEARLGEARVAFEKAWALKPGMPNVAFPMLIVEKGIGGGDREKMEVWFERAMMANGNDREACWEKLEWLDPKWHGGETRDAMLAFGQECFATKNWSSGIPLIGAEAYLRQFVTLPDAERQEYLAQDKVWSDIRPAYVEYLEGRPYDEDQWRSKYAALCFFAGRYRESNKQFKLLGDRLVSWPSLPIFPLEHLKKYGEAAAMIVEKENKTGARISK